MTNTSLRKYWITLTSLCTIGATIVLACAGDWGPEYGNSSFTPQVFVDSAYSPFFYSNQFYYGINYDEDYITRWKQTNIDAGTDVYTNAVLLGNAQYNITWFGNPRCRPDGRTTGQMPLPAGQMPTE